MTTMSHPFVEALSPLLEAVGAELVPVSSATDGDVPLRWDGQIVAVGDKNATSPVESLRAKNVTDNLHAMVANLDPREAEIIKYRFGLDGYDELTLEEVGRKFRVTRERVRQLQNIALSKMRKEIAIHETQRTTEEIAEEHRLRRRMEVIREFIQARSGNNN